MCCILVCIRSNARVPVILPDWHNYGWDVWRNTWGVSSDHLHSCEGCSLVQAGKTFIQGEVSLDQPEGLVRNLMPAKFGMYKRKMVQEVPKVNDLLHSLEWWAKLKQLLITCSKHNEQTHDMLERSDIAPSSARHKVSKLHPCLFFLVRGASFPLMWGHGL